MLVKDLREEISRRPARGARGGKKGSAKRNSNTCKMDMRLEFIQTRDLYKGNELCLISPSSLDEEIGYGS